jgi:ribosomal protein S18 acetylase RimI-like enzyme
MLKRIRINSARESDIPLIKLLLGELVEVVEDTNGFDLEQSVINIRELMKDPDHCMLVARDQSQILGLISFSNRKTILHPGPSGLIDELVVAKTSRGSGIGKQLTLAAVNKCRELGCCEVEVSTEKSNKRARKFYGTLGFDESGVLLELDL